MMSYQILVRQSTEDIKDLQLDICIDAAAVVLEQQAVPSPTTLTIVLTNDEETQALNRQYRGVDSPTDVLSFAADPLPNEVIDPQEGQYLGDIVISVPYTARRVENEPHSLDDEIALLVVHGTLHLLGFDHQDAPSQQTMWAQQKKALEKLGIDINVPDYFHED